MRHGSLFSGIGGFDLAAKWMGWANVFQVEKDAWCRSRLVKNFPETERYSDIIEFKGDEYKDTIDVISGGFPCQPFSVAGKRKGKEDDRYLWGEMLRVIGSIRPPFVVGENVTGIVSMALDTVLFDLEAKGYTTETYIIPACGKNAWHRRDRVWIIAYHEKFIDRRYNAKPVKRQESESRKGFGENDVSNPEIDRLEHPMLSRGWRTRSSDNNSGDGGVFTDTGSQRIEESVSFGEAEQFNSYGGEARDVAHTNGPRRQEQRRTSTNETRYDSPKCASWWEVEPAVGRVVDGVPHRVDRIKALGNAVVPQIPYEIFKAIEMFKNHLTEL